MKKLTISICIPITILLIANSCLKIKMDIPAQEDKKQFIIRVIEVGTELPLNGAEYRTSTCAKLDYYGTCPSWNKKTTFTNSEGKLIASRDDFRNHRIIKTGYWPYIDEPDRGVYMYSVDQDAPVTYYFDTSGYIDSLLVKLFPVTTITVKIKNSNTASDGIFKCNTFFNNQSAHGKEIYLNAGIDTSFQYDVFGAALNKMFIVRNSYPLFDTVSIQAKDIAKNDVLSLEFSY